MGKKSQVSIKKTKKQEHWGKLWKLLDEHTKILIVNCNNVGSRQFQDIRQAIRPLGATILMGKNTMIKAGILRKMREPEEGEFDYEARKDTYKSMPELERLIGLCKGNTGLIFCQDNIAEVKNVLSEFTRQKGAKVGVEAPDDVWIPAGSTGLDPKQTGFFQALNIPTKIVKTQIEIQQDVKILTAGQKIGASECALLDKLNIKPFIYKMKVLSVYDDGSVFGAEVLDISDEDILQKFMKGCNNIAALSMEAGYPTKVSVAHSVMRGFKQLVASILDTDYEFEKGKKLKEMALNPEAFAVAAPTEAKKEEVKEEVAEEPEKEEADVDVGGLFGDEEEEWQTSTVL